jgi:hypothetical protein
MRVKWPILMIRWKEEVVQMIYPMGSHYGAPLGPQVSDPAQHSHQMTVGSWAVALPLVDADHEPRADKCRAQTRV